MLNEILTKTQDNKISELSHCYVEAGCYYWGLKSSVVLIAKNLLDDRILSGSFHSSKSYRVVWS